MCRVLPVVLDFFGRVDTHFSRFEGLKTAPHGPLEDLLHFVRTLVDAKVTTTVFVTVLNRKTEYERGCLANPSVFHLKKT